MHHVFFIRSSVDGHLGCFHVLAVVHSAAVNTGVHVSFQISVFAFFEFVSCTGIVIWIWICTGSYGSSMLSIMAAPIYVLTNNVRGFPFLHILSNICILICTSLMISNIEHLFMYLLAIYLSLKKHQIRSSAHWLIRLFVFLI